MSDGHTNPFLLPPRSVISFSGGRTSGLMLRRVLDAFGGTLPDDRQVIFCNTGKEREETLEFVERCSQRWDVPITWLEFRREEGRNWMTEVDFATASRNGFPFDEVIRSRGFLPNPVARFCTVELKMRTMNRYVRFSLGWEKYTSAVGLRGDERKRVMRALKTNQLDIQRELFETAILKKRSIKSGRPTGETVSFPLFDAGVTLEDVTTFWGGQPFDLGLTQDEGNCDLCFLKGGAKTLKLIKARPESAEWWAKAEGWAKATFRSDRPSYRELQMIATDKQDGPGWLWADQGNDGSCGEIEECRCTD